MNSFSFLLVDDEQEFIEALALRLRQRGYTVECTFTGPEALKRLEKGNSVDIVLLDISMPGPDGMKTLQKIKLKHPLIEVIMLTGHATTRSAVEALKFGAFNYLTKPCDLKDLISLSEQAVVRKRAREAKLLDARMKPYISDQDRKELIYQILDIKYNGS
jgi:DNA-binding NtrC family response regulator